MKGVGAKRKELYKKLGIETVGELLEHYPRSYVDLTGELTIAGAVDNTYAAVKAMVTAKSGTKAIRRGLTVSKVRATDFGGELYITFFNGVKLLACCG